MKFLKFDYFDSDSLEDYKLRAAYLLDVANEYDLDNPEFSRKLREFRDEKVSAINRLLDEILEETRMLEDYTSHVQR